MSRKSSSRRRGKARDVPEEYVRVLDSIVGYGADVLLMPAKLGAGLGVTDVWKNMDKTN